MLTAAAREAVIAVARARGPHLIATDLDGTLAPILDEPSRARVPAAALATLGRLATVARVGVITGRDLATARRMVPVEDVLIMGSHGLEASFESRRLPAIDRDSLAASLERLEQSVITAVPGAFLHIERKSISTAFHFRRQPDLELLLRAALTPLPPGLRLREGRMVYEVIPDVDGGKDVALRALVEHLKPQALVVLGDDLTDVAMFQIAHEFRDSARESLVLGVSGGAETPPGIEAAADVMLRSTEHAAAALDLLATELGAAPA